MTEAAPAEGGAPGSANRGPLARRPYRKREIVIVAGLLAVHLGLLVCCAVNKSVCYDEGPHLAAGLAYLRYGEFSIYNLSPPPLRMLAAAPVYLLGEPNIPLARPVLSVSPHARPWAYYEAFQDLNLVRLHELVLAGRFTLIPVSAACGALAWWWARRLYGPAGGLIALGAWTFSPTVLALGSTFGTDMPLAATVTAAAMAWAGFLLRPTPARCLLATSLVAAAHGVKFNAVLLFPAMLAIALVLPRGTGGWRERLGSTSVGLFIAIALSYVVLCAGYGFHLTGDRLGSFRFSSSMMQSLAATLPGDTPVPFPRYLVEGFDAQKWEAETVYPQTLFDEGYFGTDWRYYPLHWFCKSTIGGLLLAGLAIGSLAWRRPTRSEAVPLALAVTFVGGMLLLARINLCGTRYLLPAYPAAMVLLGRVAAPGAARSRTWPAWLGGFAVALGAAESVAAAPRYHSFYNFAATPLRFEVPESDWGQAALELARWARRHDATATTEVVGITLTRVEAYGLRPAEPAGTSERRYVAISATLLQGLPANSRGRFVFVRPWRRLRQTPPVADLGGLLVFDARDVFVPGEPPPLAVVGSWEDALREPTLIRLRNFDERVRQGR